MKRARRTLGAVTMTWLLCHAMTLILAPVVSWPTSVEASTCSCTHGDHASCPMRHKPAPNSKICVISGADNPGLGVLVWLLNVGLLPASLEAAVPEIGRASFLFGPPVDSFRGSPPDPPPPRV